MNYRELNLRAPDVQWNTIKLNSGIELDVRVYLPIDAKADLITWVLQMSIDEKTGCISPLRLETYFSLAIVKWYAGIEIDISENFGEVYDILEQNGVIDSVMEAIPEDEMVFIRELMMDTAEDIARYNNSFMGMMTAMSNNTGEMDEQITDILEKLKNAEGLEQLAVIKDMVGTD